MLNRHMTVVSPHKDYMNVHFALKIRTERKYSNKNSKVERTNNSKRKCLQAKVCNLTEVVRVHRT